MKLFRDWFGCYLGCIVFIEIGLFYFIKISKFCRYNGYCCNYNVKVYY